MKDFIEHDADCERLEMMLSSRIDGELELSDQRELEIHLESCTECRRKSEAFLAIDLLVLSASNPKGDQITRSVSTLQSNKVCQSNKLRNKSRGGFFKRTALRWMPAAISAAVLISIIVVTIPSAPSVTAGQIAIPLAELEMINVEQSNSQERLLRTLELELRAMKLEVRNLSSASESDKNRIELKLLQLIEKVGQYRK